jgi:hypothetical protein
MAYEWGNIHSCQTRGGPNDEKSFDNAVSAVLVLILAGVSLAADITGNVTYLDLKKGVISVKSHHMETAFGCDGSMLADIEVGDMVKVDVGYTVEKGKKVAKSMNKK